MPEIGATLREARARQRVDIAEVEVDTKIRAKYLRALENEEWDLLPGTTYVKSFLRTYAEALGLDGRLLVEEYKLRHERLSDVELQPISPRSAQPARGRRGSSRGVPRWLVVGVIVAGLVVALYFLGSRDDPPRVVQPTEPRPATVPSGSAQGSTGGASPSDAPDDAARERRREQRRTRTVRLQIVPLGPVFACLTAAGRGTLLDGVELQPGDAMRTFRSRRFRLTLGNDRARLRINGRLRSVPPVTNGIGYEITRSGRRTLSASERPTCA